MNEVTKQHGGELISTSINKEIANLRASPERYYALLKAETEDSPRGESTPCIAQIESQIGREESMLAICVGIAELRDFFNVKGNMTDKQIALAAELILDRPSLRTLSLNEIKGVFREKMSTAKLYDRLDGNLIISWLVEYASRASETAYLMNANRNKSEESKECATDYDTWLLNLTKRADSGDENAIAHLARHIGAINKPSRTSDEIKQKDEEFRKFQQEYIRNRILNNERKSN